MKIGNAISGEFEPAHRVAKIVKQLRIRLFRTDNAKQHLGDKQRDAVFDRIGARVVHRKAEPRLAYALYLPRIQMLNIHLHHRERHKKRRGNARFLATAAGNHIRHATKILGIDVYNTVFVAVRH